MPVEKFYDPSVAEHEAEDTGLKFVVRWGNYQPEGRSVELGPVALDRSGINRLIRVLRTARDKAYGRDE